MKRVMYIENKSDGLSGAGRIGWVEMSRSTRSYTYAGKRFLKTKSGYKYNCIEEETGAHYWISGPKRKAAIRCTAELSTLMTTQELSTGQKSEASPNPST